MDKLTGDERDRFVKEKGPGAAKDMFRIADRTRKAAELIEAGDDAGAIEKAVGELSLTWVVLAMAALASPNTPTEMIKEAAAVAIHAAERFLGNQAWSAQAAEPTEEHNPWLH